MTLTLDGLVALLIITNLIYVSSDDGVSSVSRVSLAFSQPSHLFTLQQSFLGPQGLLIVLFEARNLYAI